MSNATTISACGAASDFEAIYRAAAQGTATPPWDDGRPNPLFLSWLDRGARDIVRPGARIAVVGCGHGHDARALLARGYDVTAFDVSPTAIETSRRLHADWSEAFHTADLFALPTRWQRRFDLVVEIYTIQSLPPESRQQSMSAIQSLLHPHGAVFLLARACEQPARNDEGPPWPLTLDELRELTSASGLEASDGIELLIDDEAPSKRRMRTILRRVAGGA
ncbi:MAG: methyltransferase domain-containing protein [Phycisphaerae bacterium]|nr:methyltransferase domain-containing protein [Phycisphaerae bacterium]